MEAPPGLSNEEPAGTAAGASTNGRRKMFDSHLEAEAIEAGLASGALGGRNGGVEVFWMLDGIFLVFGYVLWMIQWKFFPLACR